MRGSRIADGWTRTSSLLSVRALRALIGMIFLLATVILYVTLLWHVEHNRRTGTGSPTSSVAVLPFLNLAGTSYNSARFTLADNVALAIAESLAFEVRPSWMSRRYTGPFNPEEVGRGLRVNYAVGGHYVADGENLIVTVEVIDVARDRLKWISSFTVPAQDAEAMQQRTADCVYSGALAAMGSRTTEWRAPRDGEVHVTRLVRYDWK